MGGIASIGVASRPKLCCAHRRSSTHQARRLIRDFRQGFLLDAKKSSSARARSQPAQQWSQGAVIEKNKITVFDGDAKLCGQRRRPSDQARCAS